MAILKDTTLAAIVRDEIMNPAGGVERWLRSTLPYVEEAVIVDTGSIDGTREKLEELSKEFPHMRVYDKKWKGFSDARNFSLKKVTSKRVLILDADEIIADGNKSIAGGYRKLARFVESNPAIIHMIDCDWIYPTDGTFKQTFHSRLFLNLKSISFRGNIPLKEKFYRDSLRARELKEPEGIPVASMIRGPKIKQFCSSMEGVLLKRDNFYYRDCGMTSAPSQVEGFNEWKAYNPKRDEYN